MKTRAFIVFLIIAVIVLAFRIKISVAQTQCGIERWNVKTLSDPDTTQIDFSNEVKSSVSEQITLTAPKNFPKDLPRQKTEETVYKMRCDILGFKKESDKDIHIVIQDPTTKDKMIAEIPSDECPDVQKTSRYTQIKELNEWFINNIGSPTQSMTWLQTPKEVDISGVGFFDFPHGQTGRAPNGREIHPVLSMDYAIGPNVSSPPTDNNQVVNKIQGSIDKGVFSIQIDNTTGGVLSLIALAALLGMAGQLVRLFAGIKKSNDSKAENAPKIDTKQLAFSLLISVFVGAAAGVLAAFNIIGTGVIDKSTMMTFIAAGYAGTDLIEGFIVKQ